MKKLLLPLIFSLSLVASVHAAGFNFTKIAAAFGIKNYIGTVSQKNILRQDLQSAAVQLGGQRLGVTDIVSQALSVVSVPFNSASTTLCDIPISSNVVLSRASLDFNSDTSTITTTVIMGVTSSYAGTPTDGNIMYGNSLISTSSVQQVYVNTNTPNAIITNVGQHFVALFANTTTFTGNCIVQEIIF